MNDSLSPIKNLKDEDQNALNIHTQQQEQNKSFIQERAAQNNDPHNSDIDNMRKNQNNKDSIDQAKIVKRQPLKLKFKGIIINKVLGQIYHKDRKCLLHESIISIKNVKQRTTTFKRINLQQLQRRIMMATLQTFQFLISKYITKISKKCFDTLNNYST